LSALTSKGSISKTQNAIGLYFEQLVGEYANGRKTLLDKMYFKKTPHYQNSTW
jgi:hypothetical protein